MNATIDMLRGELERLFSLDEMTLMSEQLLGLRPADVGGAMAKASFAKALTERCHEGDCLEALVDVIVASKQGVDPRVHDLAALRGPEELAPGACVSEFTIQTKLGVSELAYVYLAQKRGTPFTLKVIRREPSRDRRALQRFLIANRLVATVAHDGLPKRIEAGELDAGQFYVAYEHLDAQTLAAWFARTGPSHISELIPLLRSILEPLAALHRAQIVHGDLKLDNVLVANSQATQEMRAVLIDFGTDRLRQRSMAANGHTGLLAVYGSPKTIAPELVRGRPADARSDVYAIGAMMYELLSGKPVFASESAPEAAFAHLTTEPLAPSTKAPRGWITRDVDAFVMSLLQKDPAQRPRDASALLDAIHTLNRAFSTPRALDGLSPEKVQKLVDDLLATPSDAEIALALEKAVDDGANADLVAQAFVTASNLLDGMLDGESAKAAREIKKDLLFRAARIFEGGASAAGAKEKENAEKTYVAILQVDRDDEIAATALEEIRKQLGKYDEVVEMLVARSEASPPGDVRARMMAEIGKLYAHELHDPEQALVAYTSALCEAPLASEYGRAIEALAGASARRWTEVLTAVAEASRSDALSTTERSALLAQAGHWYDAKLGRADTALLAFQQILASDPASEVANEGLTHIYRRAQQWPELVEVLLARAAASVSPPRARDLRAEAAEILETRLNDGKRAKEICVAVLSEDPGHARAGDALARIAEASGDFETLVHVLERQADVRRGNERVAVVLRMAEVYEEHLNNLAEATRRFDAAIALDPSNLDALKGLDRIFARTGKHRELLENLERQVELSATPRQKTSLYERIASIYDEEFLDHAKSAEALEAMLALDGASDNGLTHLARHYRALDKWEELVKLYDKHVNVTGDEARRVELMVARARVLADQIGSPDRATKAYEQVLERVPGHGGTLEALARLRELAGDSHAALSAIEALAARATTPAAQAEQWMRAARLLETRGDKDGAIERYKLALEANPKDGQAAAALRNAYARRGDTQSLLALIDKELTFAEGNLAKARLHAEMARVYYPRLEDVERADVSAKRAFDLDPTNADALMVLGDLAFDAGRVLEATKYYETLVGRVGALPKEDAVRVIVQYLEASAKSLAPIQESAMLSAASPESQAAPPLSSRVPLPPPSVVNRVSVAIDSLQELAADDADAMERASRVAFQFADAQTARLMNERLLAGHSASLTDSDRAAALHRVGEAMRRMGDGDAAIDRLRESADLDPSASPPLVALAKIYADQGAWDAVVRTKNRRLEVASGTERFELLLEIGDIEFTKLNDRTRASKTYVTALEERPDDRKLLTKLMQLYSEEKDWAKLVEVVVRLAEFVEDAKQRAKYMHTAAIVSSRQMGETEKALGFYDRALLADPTLTKALEEALELRRVKGDHEGVEKLLKMQLEQAKASQDRAKLTDVLDQLGKLYQKFLNDPELAIDAFEAAQAFDPDDRQRAETLAELYASDVAHYLDKAVKAQAQILRRNPYRAESYKLLRRLYTEAKHADAAWCLCQALNVLNLAEPDEERFYKRHRADSPAAALEALADDDWATLLAHADLDPMVTRIFAVIQPTIIRARTQMIHDLGYDPSLALDIAHDPSPVAQTLYYAQGVLGTMSPPVYQNPNDPSGLGFLHARSPAIVLGRAAFDARVSGQALAFVAGRHLAYFRPGFYVRHLVPTGTGLKAWLFAAIKMSVPHFPIAPDVQGQVDEAVIAMRTDFQGADKERLASVVSKLLQSGGALDLKKWVAAIDLTADRAGFLLAHDLELTAEAMRATEAVARTPAKERMKEIVLFSVSEEYFGLRQKLQITID
jgi:serine/threonine protein kinase/lipopolysaccharide biosynthesis regulator YciM